MLPIKSLSKKENMNNLLLIFSLLYFVVLMNCAKTTCTLPGCPVNCEDGTVTTTVSVSFNF